MTDVVFAFGPEGYFFESQTQWKMKDLPPRLAARFASGSSDIAHVHQLVMGAGESWFLSYRTRAGGASFAHDGLPEKLAAWLRLKDANGYSVRNIPKLRISLGQYNASFWAEDGKDYFWDNLPGPLQMALEKLKSPQGGWSRLPQIVTLGVNQSYVMISEGGGGSYAVSDYYPWLEKELVALIRSGKPGALKTIHHISMDQHDGQNFVMTTVEGQVYYYVPDSLSADMHAIRITIPKTPAGGYLIAREAETGENPMPIPQSVSVPSGGLNVNRSPEEAHSQQMGMDMTYGTGSHLVHSHTLPPAGASSTELSHGPAPPYSSNPQSTQYANVQVSHAHTPAQTTPTGPAARVSSPLSLYRHPRVTALENAAATTRIVSPVPSMSQSQYSHEVRQYDLNGRTQRIMSPPPAIVEQPTAANNASDIVSPSPVGHQGLAQVAVGTNHGTLARPPTSSTTSSSPITHTSNSHPSYTGQSVQEQHNVPVSHAQRPSDQGQGESPLIAPVQDHSQMPGQETQENVQQSTPSTSPQLLPGSPQVKPPPVPNPTPIQYNVQIAGSPPASISGSQLSQASISPVPVVHSPGTPSRIDTVAVPTISTPAPQPDKTQPRPQLVSIPIRPVAQSLTPQAASSSSPSMGIGPAEISASPPPHRQSVSSPISTASQAQSISHSSQRPSIGNHESISLPGAVPFMPPSKPSSPVAQPGTSPIASPAPLNPQLVQVASAPSYSHIQQSHHQPQLVRVVSSPVQVQANTGQGIPQPVGTSQVVRQQQMNSGGISSPANSQQGPAPAAKPQAARISTGSTQNSAGGQQQQRPQPPSQGQKLATAFGIGLARGAVKAIIN